MKKKLQFALIVTIPIIICIVAVSVRVSVNQSAAVTIEGDVEVDLSPYYSQVTGEVKSLPIGIGQTVKKGDVLAILDDTQARFELSQLEQALVKAQAALRDLKQTDHQATKQAQVDIAKNNMIVAEQALALEKDTLARLQEDHKALTILYEAGAVSKTDIDIMADKLNAQENAITAAQAQLNNAKAQLVIAGTDTSSDLTEKKNMAQADINMLQAQIEYATSQLEHYSIRAQENGVLISLAYDEGSLALTGTEVCEMSKEDQKKFVFYLPEEYIAYIDYGMELLVTEKSKSKDMIAREYKATVVYLDLKAQYTPKEAESSANKNRLSFKVEAVLPPDCDLHVAQKASVTFGK